MQTVYAAHWDVAGNDPGFELYSTLKKAQDAVMSWLTDEHCDFLARNELTAEEARAMLEEHGQIAVEDEYHFYSVTEETVD